ncbi:sugar phosphate isomerase/epimerase [Rhodococcus sp. 14-2470-1b]|uniref:sugar phosphate isomerase/epimerase family protein n=1 Tax=Rhodococcus sp. 14-2470-1b TaxID=2023149 RepID=UPI0020CFD902|nr:sugar phosphate isomerase/epimerase [Rhodococcus sp. 14-2470-1b]
MIETSVPGDDEQMISDEPVKSTDNATRVPADMIAACWTSAGNVRPDASPALSPIPITERIAAIASAGFAGMGIVAADLAAIEAGVGLRTLRAMLDDSPLKFVEIELLEKWWIPRGEDGNTFAVRDLLFRASDVLGPTHIKIGSENAEPRDLAPYTEPLLELTRQAAEHGTRIALEPMPFSIVSTIPAGADLARSTGHPDCGIIVDAWHVFRAGTTLDELRDSLTSDVVFGIELDDADAEVVGTLLSDTMDNRRLCGDGTFDLTGLVGVLRDIGYTGTWGTEILSTEFRSTALDLALKRAIDTARAFVE